MKLGVSLMDVVTPAQASFVGLSRAAAWADPLEASRRLARPSFFWEQGPEQLLCVGFGTCAVEQGDAGGLKGVLERVERAPLQWLDEGGGPSSAGPWFGGFAFDPVQAPDAWWEGFPTTRWVMPSLLLRQHRAQQSLCAFEQVAADDVDGAIRRCQRRLDEALEKLALRTALETRANPGLELHEGDRPGWDALMALALASIEAGALEKVVLARPMDVHAQQAWEPLDVVERARASGAQTTIFMVTEPSGGAFIGATPELLCEIDGTRLSTEALASSASPRDTKVLASGDKERREHQSVVDSIRTALGPLSERISVRSEPKLLELSYVAHLRTPVEVTLRHGVSAASVILALHPTSAVGGTPRVEALAFLRDHEKLHRGWYAGAVGWMGPGRVHLNVALRSAVLRGNRARLFVGAGVVRGSTSEREWNETALKSRPMLSALGELRHG